MTFPFGPVVPQTDFPFGTTAATETWPYGGLPFTYGTGSVLGTFYADFAGDSYQKDRQTALLADVFSVSRASEKWAEDVAGSWAEFANNVAARTDKGLSLSNVAFTNYVLGGDMAGAVTGSPGTMPTKLANPSTVGTTRTVTTGVTEKGFPCIDVTFTGNFNATTFLDISLIDIADAIAAVAGDRIDAGIWLALKSGTAPTSVNLAVYGLNVSDGNAEQTVTPLTGLDSTLRYYSISRVLAQVATVKARSMIRINTTNGATSGNFTLRIAAPFTSKNQPITSPVPIITTGTAKTQEIDAASLLLPATPTDVLLTFSNDQYRVIFDKSGTYGLQTSDILNGTMTKAQDVLRRGPPVYDNFETQADGDLPGRIAKSGQTWQNVVGSGGAAVNAEIISGSLVAKISGTVSSPNTNCYSALVADQTLVSLYCDIGFGAGSGIRQAVLIGCSEASLPGILSGSIHIIFTYNGFNVQYFDPANYPPGNTPVGVATVVYTTPMPQDGTKKPAGWRLVGTTLYVLGQDGIERSYVNAIWPTLVGNVVIIEHALPNADGGSSVQFANVYAGDDAFLVTA